MYRLFMPILLITMALVAQGREAFHFLEIPNSYAYNKATNQYSSEIVIFCKDSIIDTVLIFGTTAKDDSFESILFIDYNFDGHMDFIYTDETSASHMSMDRYYYIFDPKTSKYIYTRTSRELNKLLFNKDGSFTTINYFDYLGCYDTIIHYKDTTIEKIHCNYDEIDF